MTGGSRLLWLVGESDAERGNMKLFPSMSQVKIFKRLKLPKGAPQCQSSDSTESKLTHFVAGNTGTRHARVHHSLTFRSAPSLCTLQHNFVLKRLLLCQICPRRENRTEEVEAIVTSQPCLPVDALAPAIRESRRFLRVSLAFGTNKNREIESLVRESDGARLERFDIS